MNMHFVCMKPTKKIVFHSVGLDINTESLSIYSPSDSSSDVSKSLEFDEKRGFVILTMNHECVQNGEYTLKIDYSGTILPVLYGFYRSTYVINGETK